MDQNPNRKDGDTDTYIPAYNIQKIKEFEVRRCKDMLSRILGNVEGFGNILKEIKEHVSTLSLTVTSHSVSIN